MPQYGLNRQIYENTALKYSVIVYGGYYEKTIYCVYSDILYKYGCAHGRRDRMRRCGRGNICGYFGQRGGGAGVMPTEQALCGLAAALHFENGESGIFDMSAADKTEQNRINAAELLWYIRMRRYTKGNVFLYNYVCRGSGQR